MEDILEKFKSYLVAKGLGSLYLIHIKGFLSYCEREKIDYTTMNIRIYTDFVSYMRLQKYSEGYINNFIKSIRSFYKFLFDHRYVESKEVMEDIAKIKTTVPARKIYKTTDLQKIDKFIEYSGYYNFSMCPYKVRAILYFMLYTGVRKVELLNLKRADIDINEKCAIIRLPTKSNKEKIIYFPNRVAKALKEYFSLEPETVGAFNLKRGGIEYLFRFIKNFDKELSPHSMRRSFANMLHEKGIDIKIIQELMGHANIETTLLYINPNQKLAKETYRSKIH